VRREKTNDKESTEMWMSSKVASSRGGLRSSKRTFGAEPEGELRLGLQGIRRGFT